MHPITVVLTALAVVISQVSAQSSALDGIPSQCLPTCTPFSNTYEACQALDTQASQTTCMCKDSLVQTLAQCGACVLDPAVPFPDSDRPTPQIVQASVDSIIAGCAMAGITLQPIDVSKISNSASNTTSSTGTGQDTSTTSATSQPTTSTVSQTLTTSFTPSTPTPTSNSTTTDASDQSAGDAQSTPTKAGTSDANRVITNSVIVAISVVALPLLLSW